MQIRKATPADSQAIGMIQLTSWQTMFPDASIIADDYLAQFSFQEREEDWHDLLASLGNDQIVYVAENDANEVVGYALGKLDDHAAYQCELVSIHILPAYRGQGLGQRLIATLVKDFQQRGRRSFWLWVLKGNRARRLYERLGGQLVGEQHQTTGKNEIAIEIVEVAYGWSNIDTLANLSETI